jgi:hypothetical protein
MVAVCAYRDKYRVLERFEVQVPDAQLDLLDRLDGEWAKFQVGPCAAGICLHVTPVRLVHIM